MAELPEAHYASLAEREAAYFWHQVRAQWVERLVRRAFSAPEKLSVVDYGCGTGGLLRQLHAKMGFRAHLGVDPSPDAIEVAQQRGGHYRRVEEGRFQPPPDTDVVLMMDVLEHIEDDLGFLMGLIPKLHANARLILSVPAFPSLYSDWDRQLGHHRRYTRTSLRRTLESAGAQVEFIRYAFAYLVPRP